MKLSEVQLILTAKQEYDRTKKEIKYLNNYNLDLKISISSTMDLYTNVQHRNATRIRDAVLNALLEYEKELVTELTLFGVTDFEH